MQRHILLLCICLTFCLSACGGSPVIGYATIDGYADVAQELIDPVNVWDNYKTRTAIVARVRHGERVGIVRREGDGVLIETSNGVRGWLTYTFLRDIK